HALCGRVDLTEIAHFTAAIAIRDRYCITCLRNIDPYKSFCTMIHGSFSCDEDRLGPPEQPSPPRVGRATSFQRRTYGLTRLSWGAGANIWRDHFSRSPISRRAATCWM